MKYLIIYLCLIFTVYSAEIEVVVTRKSDGKIVAGDRGEGVSLQSVKRKMKVSDYDPSVFTIEIINHSDIKAAKDARFNSFDENHPKYKQYLKEIVKEWLKKKRMEPGD